MEWQRKDNNEHAPKTVEDFPPTITKGGESNLRAIRGFIAVVAALTIMATPALANPIDTLYEKTVGCNGKLPLFCPGPPP